ncbi:FmdE family protein [Methanobacterium sp.]|uniref:FmdE family protein n=1 Tax=Methanobacterium sp. TaxID=2164 RepID=UPI003C7405FF
MEDSDKIKQITVPFSEVGENEEHFRYPKNQRFLEVTKFHGHVCPGSAIGYHAAEIAIKELSSSRSEDEEFLAIVENDSCSVDAIQVVTGCTFGKGNLIFKDHGKQVFTFINRNTGDALRVSLNKDINEIDPEFAELRKKAFSRSAGKEEKIEFEKRKNELSQKILDLPDDELFKIEHVKIEIPEEARMFPSVKCAKCGEMVAEHRARVENSNFVCIPCFEDYSRT